MYLSEAVNKTKAELNKLPKSQLVDTISNYGYQLKNATEGKAKAEAALDAARRPNDQLCMMMLSFLGDDIPQNEYSGQPDLSKVDMWALVGRLMAECIRQRNGNAQ